MPELSRVLHVDDDEGVREVVRIALEVVGGLQVLSCDGHAGALSKAAAFAPDLLLLDVMMPGMDGPELLAALRAQPGLVATPAVFMTAKALNNEVDALMRAGALAVIRKPFDPMRLAAQLRGLLLGKDSGA